MEEMLIRAHGPTDPRKPETQESHRGRARQTQRWRSHLQEGDREAHDQESRPYRAEHRDVPGRMMVEGVRRDQKRHADRADDPRDAGCQEKACSATTPELDVAFDRGEDPATDAFSHLGRCALVLHPAIYLARTRGRARRLASGDLDGCIGKGRRAQAPNPAGGHLLDGVHGLAEVLREFGVADPLDLRRKDHVALLG